MRAAPDDSGATTTSSSSGSSGSPVVYQGVYGPWSVTKEDELEVLW